MYIMPKINAPSPNGMSKKSKSATVAKVRIRMFTHMGRIKSMTTVRDVRLSDRLNIHAAG